MVKQEDGKDDVYVVDGILKKHQNFISGEIASGAAAGTTVAVYNMDNRVLVFGDVYPSSGFSRNLSAAFLKTTYRLLYNAS